MTGPLKEKNILLGISGGIAAYKSAELLRLLTKSGAEVRVVMTANAAKFVTPLTFSSLSGSPVITNLFSTETGSGIDHIEYTDWADLFLIAPATANVIGKLASGLGDDALTTMALAFDGAFLIAPAMNTKMYKNSIVQENIEKLKRYGFTFVGPASGELACGYEGTGRMVEPPDIAEAAISALYKKDLEGKSFLVSAGPTREMIDPVRFISNRSSGKMGYAIAREAARRGAKVTLVTGPTAMEPPLNVEVLATVSAKEMHDVVIKGAKRSAAVIMAAAVADYAPKEEAAAKIKKGGKELNLEFFKTADILEELGKKKEGLLVGFAAETENLIENASQKLSAKNLDLIVANDVSGTETGFDADDNRVSIIDKSGIVKETPKLPKDEVARIILDVVSERLA